MIVGQVIAVGIFLTPAAMAKSVRSPFWLFLIWIVLGFQTLSGALCYGELASRFPEAGGIYVYLREAFGKPWAFLYGWMVLLVLDPGLTAVFGVGLASYTGYLIELSPSTQKVLAVSVVVVIGLINIVGARIGADFLKALTILKIATLLFIILYGFLGGFGNWAHFTPFFAQPPDLFGALAGGLVSAFFAYAGWWEVTRIAGEMENPQRDLPKALAIGVVIITVVYVLTSAVFFYLVPLAQVTSDETFAAQAGEAMFGKTGGIIFSLIVVISVLGSLFAYLMASPRVYYAMAKDGLFFKSFGELHSRFNTPHRATIIQMALASVLILSGTFKEIISYFFFVVVFFVALAAAGLFKFRKQEFDGYNTAFFPFTPIFFLAVTAIVLVFIAIGNPFQTFLGIAVVLIGLPVYYFLFRNR